MSDAVLQPAAPHTSSRRQPAKLWPCQCLMWHSLPTFHQAKRSSFPHFVVAALLHIVRAQPLHVHFIPGHSCDASSFPAFCYQEPRHLLSTPAPSCSRPNTVTAIHMHSNVLQSCVSCCTHSHSGAGLTLLPVRRQALGDPVSRRAPILCRLPELPRRHHVVVAQRPAACEPLSCSPGADGGFIRPAADGTCGLLQGLRSARAAVVQQCPVS